MPTDQTNSRSNDRMDQKDNDADHRKMREKLKRAKSEPVLSVGRMTLASHVFRGHDQPGSSFDEQTVENHISEEFPASEMFDISAGGNDAVRHSRTGINDKQVTESLSKETTTLSLQVSQGNDENSTREEGETSKNGGEVLPSADLEKSIQEVGDKKGSKFFISETSDIDRDSVRGRSPAVREIHVGDSPSGNVKEYEEGEARNSSEIGSQELSRNDEESKQEKTTENSAKSKKESCKDEESLKSKSRDDDDKDGGDGDGRRHETGVHRGVEGTGQGSQGGGNDGSQQQNYNNSGQGKQAVNQSDLEDVPDLDEAVLFCSYCGQDIDECECVYSQERNSQGEMSFKELALVSRYERILSAAGGGATPSEVDEGRSRLPGSGRKTRPRPESAPCGMTGTMMVMRGTGIQSKEISPIDNQSRVEIVKGNAKMKSALNSPERGVDNMTIVASTKPRHDRSGAEQGLMIPPMGFKVNARPPMVRCISSPTVWR
ncbi:hypothetical protein BSL78_25226 [Apostichopus japonicus]|uniref:Uncharacterized protein n=1 Tax=Stichopus japonicus TaxID=307972 RepID=A0A2G8JQA4_STIJA|nr:hypothetical protein BSL78_25226 [Apostichopus japonicus]